MFLLILFVLVLCILIFVFTYLIIKNVFKILIS